MEKDNKYYSLIENLVRKNRKFPGYEEILEDIINDVYSHSEVIINSINNENVINAYLEKVISTSMITVPKKLNFYPRSRTVKTELVDRMINSSFSIDTKKDSKVLDNTNVEIGLDDLDELNDIAVETDETIDIVNPNGMSEAMNIQPALNDGDIAAVAEFKNTVSADLELDAGVVGAEALTGEDAETSLIAAMDGDDKEEVSDTASPGSESLDYSLSLEDADNTAAEPLEEIQETAPVDYSLTLEESDNTTAEPLEEVQETTPVDYSMTLEDGDNTAAEPLEEVQETASVDYSMTLEDGDNTTAEPLEEVQETAPVDYSLTLEESDNTAAEPLEEVQETVPVDYSLTLEDADNTAAEPLEEVQETTPVDYSMTLEDGDNTAAEPLEEVQETTPVDYSMTLEDADNTAAEPLEEVQETTPVDYSMTLEDGDNTTAEPFEEVQETIDASLAPEIEESGMETISETGEYSVNNADEQTELDDNEEQYLVEDISTQDDLLLADGFENIDNELLPEFDDTLSLDLDEPVVLEELESSGLNEVSDLTEEGSDSGNSGYTPTDYSKFNIGLEDEEDDIYDANEISDELAKLSGKRPELNISQVYNLKYKEKQSVPQIANQLEMAENDVIEALCEIVALV